MKKHRWLNLEKYDNDDKFIYPIFFLNCNKGVLTYSIKERNYYTKKLDVDTYVTIVCRNKKQAIDWLNNTQNLLKNTTQRVRQKVDKSCSTTFKTKNTTVKKNKKYNK